MVYLGPGSMRYWSTFRSYRYDSMPLTLANCFRFLFHPKLLKVVDTSQEAIEIGDFVCVIKAYAKVRALQDDRHGGWTEEMREVLCYLFDV